MNRQLHSFKLDYRITNTSQNPVLVKMKGGLSYIVKRSEESTYLDERHLYVTVTNVFLNQLMINEDEALTKLDKEILKALQTEKENLINSQRGLFINMGDNLSIVIKLDRRFVERNDAIHSELLGITLYGDGENLNRPALNTPGHTFQDLLEDAKEEAAPMMALYYTIYINDPQRHTKPFYTNLGGKAVEVPVAYESDRQSGLYVGLKNSNYPQETQYYTFDELTDKLLESIGIFKSKQLAYESGNTERYISSENRNKDLQKENVRLKETNEVLVTNLQKTEERATRLSMDIQQLKSEHTLEIKTIKSHEKISSDMFKHETRIKDTINKANMDYVKQRSEQNNWSDLAKAVGTLAGIAFTGYKLLSS
jgi:hypothetical protein